MRLIVRMEILTMYIMLIYLNEMDRYSVMVIIGIGMCLIMGSSNGWVGLLILVIIWPIFSGYIEWISIWISRVKLGETFKKTMVILLIIRLILLSVTLAYVFVLAIRVYRMSSVVALRVYGWLMLGGGITILIIIYVVRNFMIELNWKVLVIRILPLPVFFIKIIGRWLVLYVVMYYRMLVITNSSRN